MSDDALVLEGIDKRFGAVQALAGASLRVRRGTVHAVLGENGAGKTTLMRIAFGMMPPDSGRVIIQGNVVALRSSADAIRRGVGMVHQHFTLVPAMSVEENIALGGHGVLDLPSVRARIAELAAHTGLSVAPQTRVATLGVGAQQRVEILKALYGDARVLILDEPSAVLTPRETEELFTWLRRFVADGGTAVLVTHKLHEAMAVADDVTVLRRGAIALQSTAQAVTIDTLVRALTGEAPASPRARRLAVLPGAVVAELIDASVIDDRGVVRVKHAHLACRAGEIIGLAGVEGSGVQELVRLLAGRVAPSEGHARLPASVGFIPEDRLRDALIESFTLTENFALRGAHARRGLMQWPAMETQTASVMSRYDVRAAGPLATGGSLSGGNQQKFVVGRELSATPPLIVAENPVRGLDLRATDRVLSELRDAAEQGSAVALYSTDLDDVLPLADRMFVVFGGTVREVPVSRDAVAAALVGAA